MALSQKRGHQKVMGSLGQIGKGGHNQTSTEWPASDPPPPGEPSEPPHSRSSAAKPFDTKEVGSQQGSRCTRFFLG